MRQKLVAAMAVLAGLMTLPALAMADMPAGTISTFNEAVQTGDAIIVVAAAKALGATAIARPEDPQAAVAAFEAANQLCLRGACADAVPMADFLNGLQTAPPVSAAELNVLSAFAAWSASAQNEGADEAFRAVLVANAEGQQSLLTIAAFEAFYAPTTTTTDWREIASRADLAATHLEPVRGLVPNRWATAELVAATAQFNDKREFASYDRVSDLAAWLQGARRDEAQRDLLRPLAYEAMAWESALSAFFQSFGRTSFSNVNRNGTRKYQAQLDAAAERAEKIRDGFPEGSSSEPPFCDGQVVATPRPNYPQRAARKGYVGSVLLGLDFENGKLTNMEVLAAIPDNTFEQASLDGMKSFRWKFDEIQEEPNCTRTKKTAIVYPFLYVLQ